MICKICRSKLEETDIKTPDFQGLYCSKCNRFFHTYDRKDIYLDEFPRNHQISEIDLRRSLTDLAYIKQRSLNYIADINYLQSGLLYVIRKQQNRNLSIKTLLKMSHVCCVSLSSLLGLKSFKVDKSFNLSTNRVLRTVIIKRVTNFKDWLWNIKIEKKLSIKRLALYLGVDHSTIQGWLYCNSLAPHILQVNTIRKKLNLDPDDIFSNAGVENLIKRVEAANQ